MPRPGSWAAHRRTTTLSAPPHDTSVAQLLQPEPGSACQYPVLLGTPRQRHLHSLRTWMSPDASSKTGAATCAGWSGSRGGAAPCTARPTARVPLDACCRSSASAADVACWSAARRPALPGRLAAAPPPLAVRVSTMMLRVLLPPGLEVPGVLEGPETCARAPTPGVTRLSTPHASSPPPAAVSSTLSSNASCCPPPVPLPCGPWPAPPPSPSWGAAAYRDAGLLGGILAAAPPSVPPCAGCLAAGGYRCGLMASPSGYGVGIQVALVRRRGYMMQQVREGCRRSVQAYKLL